MQSLLLAAYVYVIMALRKVLNELCGSPVC